MKPYEILGSEAYRDPLGEITRLFTEVMDLQGWRSELRTFENGLYRTKKTYMGKKPKAHKRIQRELERMLAAGLVIGEAFTDSQEANKVGLLDLVVDVPKGENFFREVKEFPLYLHLDAVKFPRMHLRIISIDYSIDQLLEMVRQWSHISLSKEKAGIYCSENFTPASYGAELFRVIFQVVECCHLIFVRSRKKQADEKEDFTLYPVPQEVKDAFRKIRYNFHSIPFPRWREIIAVVKRGMFDEKPVWYGSSPTEFLLTLDILKELVTLSSTITYNYTQPDWTAKATFESVLPENANLDIYEVSFPFQFPLLLTEEHIQNPTLFLDDFFDLEEGEKWLVFIDSCVKECLDCFQPMMFGFSQKKLDDLDDVLRMIEAIHLLLIRFDEEESHILVKNI